MKTEALTTDHLLIEGDVAPPSVGLRDKLRQFRDRLREERSDRLLREELADLDAHLLRDIGVADDEICRIRARDRFTPRGWRD